MTCPGVRSVNRQHRGCTPRPVSQSRWQVALRQVCDHTLTLCPWGLREWHWHYLCCASWEPGPAPGPATSVSHPDMICGDLETRSQRAFNPGNTVKCKTGYLPHGFSVNRHSWDTYPVPGAEWALDVKKDKTTVLPSRIAHRLSWVLSKKALS